MSASQLQRELLEVAQSCLARKVRQASRVICAAYDEALRPHGVKVSQFNILVAVGLLKEVTPAELAHALTLEKSTVSRNVERMLTQEWLLATASKDQRGRTYRLSRTGKALVKRALPAWKAAEDVARQRIGKDGVRGLDLLAGRVIPKL